MNWLLLLGVYLTFGFLVWLVIICHEQISSMTPMDYLRQFIMAVFLYPLIAYGFLKWKK